jgi:hypothetical protein
MFFDIPEMDLKHVGAFPVERDHDEEVGCGLDGLVVQSPVAIVPIFQCSAKYRCRIRATVSAGIICSASKRIHEHPYSAAPHANDRPEARLVPTRTRFAGHETEGRGNPSHLADPSRGPKPPASVFSLPVSMVEAPALALLMPAVGLEALKAPGIVTTGGAAVALAAVARPANPRDRAAPRGHTGALQKDHA